MKFTEWKLSETSQVSYIRRYRSDLTKNDDTAKSREELRRFQSVPPVNNDQVVMDIQIYKYLQIPESFNNVLLNCLIAHCLPT